MGRAWCLAACLLTLVLGAGTARAQPAEPPRAKSPRAEPPRSEPRAPERRRALRMRDNERARPLKELGGEKGVPPLDTDPFRAPARRRNAPGKVGKHLPWFVRPSVVFVARFSGSRSYLPQEGFGFGMQAGATLGRSTLRMSLALGYHFYRFARPLDFEMTLPTPDICTSIRALATHLVTGSAQAKATFSNLEIWAGLRGGFGHAQLKNPTPSCTIDDDSHSAGVLGPELGIGYALRADLYLGVTVAYLHFFSDKVYAGVEGTTHRFFYPLLTAGAMVSLRF